MSRAPIGTATRGGAVGAAPTVDRVWPRVVGLLVFLCAGALAGIEPGSWTWLTGWAGEPWTSEACRWSVVALVGTIAVSCLNTRPIFVVLSAGMFALSVYSSNVLIAGKLAKWAALAVGDGRVAAALGMSAAVFGYLVYSRSRPGVPNARGIFSVLIVALAGLGVANGWFTWTSAAARLGPGVERAVSDWGRELTWATALVLTSIGVSWSRTRPSHLLNAVMLVALAYACVKGGYSREVQFPELSQGGAIVKIDHASYTNVDVWRWVIAGEMLCLSAVLVNMAASMGALTVVFALVWMAAGLGLYHSLGTMSTAQVFSKGMASAAGGPLANMGLPVGGTNRAGSAKTSTRTNSSPTDAEMASAQQTAINSAIREARPILIGEATVYGWMLITSLLAGLIAVSGLRMISENAAYRYIAFGVLWVALLAGAFALAWVWPKEAGQPWEKVVAEFKLGKYHEYLFWLAFAGSMAVAGVWALVISERPSTWSNVAVAAALLGTAASLGATAVMIRFGGFPPLPIWVHGVVAAGQSSLAWALLFRAGPAAGRPRGRTAAA